MTQSKLDDAALKRFIHTSCSPVSDQKRMNELTRILTNERGFTYDQYKELWMGLFYTLWYSEMSKIGQEVIEMICYGFRLDPFPYLKAGFEILSQEWLGIDAIRMDKYFSLIRHMTHRAIRYCVYEIHELGIPARRMTLLDEILFKIYATNDLLEHFAEVYTEEMCNVLMLKVVWEKEDKAAVMVQIILPFIRLIALEYDKLACKCIYDSVLSQLRLIFPERESPEVYKKYVSSLIDHIITIASGEDVPSKSRKLLYGYANSLNNEIRR